MVKSGPAARSRLAALAAAQLCLVASAAALPSLHFGAASHHHLFCLDHHRYEDEPRLATDRSDRREDGPGLAAPASAERTHAACALSNLLLRPLLTSSNERAPSSNTCRPLELQAPRGAAHAPLPVLSLAPKHSPPVGT